MSKVGDVLNKIILFNHRRGLVAEPQPPEALGVWGEAPSRWASFCYVLEKKAILMPLDHMVLHVFRAI